MKDAKLFFISMIILLCVVYGFIWLVDYNSNNLKIEAMKAGLEQCPQEPYAHYVENRTIWVKSCSEYMINYKEINK